ncbi:uncharacterized protein LOC112523302 [Cynara cardunculus var. scolymus]|uniref:Uncharacterized protein n=1 Tax=Cynara cardunculus var. scolymus TaxID=59895 RepID=A0A103XVT9_CYNCS|nr:uncharacterized protein LOC112523302 [Cynara cardunculus var. scolymus]KVH97741.1 hypothetical protein Ccrd_000140 [Cynara cardunculus var. scolymus]
MAESHPKRHRDDDDHHSDIDTTKRHRNSYINEQQETTQDLFDFFTTLTSDPLLDFIQQPQPDPDSSNPSVKQELDDDNDEKERVIRHLLEASDDELGIPSRVESGDGGGDDEISGGGFDDFPMAFCDGLWELEDEAANYYTLLQSELFMQ